MSGKKIMWQASLVEFDILLIVLVIFFLEEVLLGSFWNIIGEDRAAFVESGLIFADSSASWFLKQRSYINMSHSLFEKSENKLAIIYWSKLLNTYLLFSYLSAKFILNIVTDEASSSVWILWVSRLVLCHFF